MIHGRRGDAEDLVLKADCARGLWRPGLWRGVVDAFGEAVPLRGVVGVKAGSGDAECARGAVDVPQSTRKKRLASSKASMVVVRAGSLTDAPVPRRWIVTGWRGREDATYASRRYFFRATT